LAADVGIPTIYVCGIVAYDGTNYHGFQVQRGVATIQGTLETALASFATLNGHVIGAGRTDTGVHASGQVIAVQVAWRHSVEALERAWNVHLPSTVVVRNLQLAPLRFHPRFSAIRRTYRYTLVQANRHTSFALPMRSPLSDRFALYETKSLDLDALCQASTYLIGRHDFATFGQPPQGENTVRQLFQADWQLVKRDLPVLSNDRGQQVVFTVTADAFLRQMVRNLVGTLLEVGRGHWMPNDVQAALAAQDRSRCAPPAPPQGLVLEVVEYPTHLGLLLK
jgi:tRNA pseudouridine38-40 synthase